MARSLAQAPLVQRAALDTTLRVELPKGSFVFTPDDPRGMTVTKGSSGNVVTYDPLVVPHVTMDLIHTIERIDFDERTPKSLMELTTGLTVETLLDNREGITDAEDLKRIKGRTVLFSTLLARAVFTLSVYNVFDVLTYKTAVKNILDQNKLTYFEPGNNDPRHIGAHDSHHHGAYTHFHLVTPAPGVSEEVKNAIIRLLTTRSRVDPGKGRPKSKLKS